MKKQAAENAPARTALRRVSAVVLLGIVAVFLLSIIAGDIQDSAGPTEVRWQGMDSGYSQITPATTSPASTERSPLMARARTFGVWILMLIVVAGVAAYAAYSYARHSLPPPSEPTIQIEKLARLATVKVTVADVLQASTGGGWTDVKGAWLVKGDALLTVDMSRAQTISKDPVKKAAVLRLPKPTVFQPRVDHTKTMTYDVQKGFLVFGTGKESQLRDEAMRQAQLLVEHAASSPETLQIARDVAVEVVKTIYRAVDWDVTIQWEDEQPGAAPKEPAKATTP